MAIQAPASKRDRPSKDAELTIRGLESLLFEAYPAADAAGEDRIGLLVGDAEAPVRSIALALDATVDSIEIAASYGCNVLVTHHPVFWIPRALFLREMGTSCANGAADAAAAAVYRAAERGVALIAMHTNVDCAPSAAGMLLDPVGYEYVAPIALPTDLASDLTIPAKRPDAPTEAPLEAPPEASPEASPEAPPEAPASPTPHASGVTRPVAGLGQLGVPRRQGHATPAPASLAELASRYQEAFEAVAKVWGDPEAEIEVLATCSGGGGELVGRVISSEADCYATGELPYHQAMELAAAGVALIELGHDRSELPYRFHMRDALLAAGIPADRLHIIEPTVSWWQPERTY